MTSVTGPQTRETQNCGVENSSATGRLPSTWLSATECIDSGGVRVVSSESLPPTLAAVSVAMSGARWPTAGIGEDLATAISPGEPMRPLLVRDSARTV